MPSKNTDQPPEPRRTLESWKEIGIYLGKGVTTVQRWEKDEGLPVHRHTHRASGTIYAFPEELDEWRAKRSRQPVQPEPAGQPQRYRGWLFVCTAVILLAAAGAGWLLGNRSHKEAVSGTSFLLTSGPAAESQVSLSPDGAFAVYAAPLHDGRGPSNLYIKPVGRGDARRLTNHASEDRWPRWSPDGTLIAFARIAANNVDIYTVTPSGTQERRIVRLSNPGFFNIEEVNWVAWTADSKSLILVDRASPSGPLALYLMPLESGTRRQLTDPPANSVGDTIAAASPDGRSLAFVRWQGGSEADLFVTPLAGGAPRRLTADNVRMPGLAWTPDGRDIFFSSTRMSALNTLWRVSASGAAPPSRISGVIDESVWPSTARLPADGGIRIAYQSATLSVNLRRWKTSPAPDTQPTAVCPSARFDWHAQFSPDGRRIAFSSTRSGSSNIWVCEPDGQARQITSFSGSYTDSPRWSPGGERLLFTAHHKDSREVFLASLGSGEIRPLTSEPSDEGRATFSRDGNSIYFRSNRSGRNEIWKMPAAGGPANQITRTGAMEGFESPDGKLLYFVRDRPRLGVWSVPVDGGEEARVVDGVRDTRWAVCRNGIYFLTVTSPHDVMMYRFDTKKTERVYTVPDHAAVRAGFTASFDGASIVWPQTVRDTSDIAVLDGVR